MTIQEKIQKWKDKKATRSFISSPGDLVEEFYTDFPKAFEAISDGTFVGHDVNLAKTPDGKVLKASLYVTKSSHVSFQVTSGTDIVFEKEVLI